MRLRSLAAAATVVVLIGGLGGPASATTTAATETVRPTATGGPHAARGQAHHRPGAGSRVVVPPHSHGPGARKAAQTTPTVRDMYEMAGLDYQTAENHGSLSEGPAPKYARSGSVPTGTTRVPGLSRHVAPSCTGTGTDGNRVQVLYVRESDQPSRFRDYLPLIRQEIYTVDDVFAKSAQKTGGGRRVRWVYGAGCVPVVKEVVVAPGKLGDDYLGTFAAVRAAGYASPGRKYLLFTDANKLCGVATLFQDSSKTDNLNDGLQTAHARVDLNCWSTTTYSVPGHELTHMLGAVQLDAPNATKYGHCDDEHDIMCYNDGSGTPMRSVCAAAQSHLLDCRNNDYFHTNPAAASYLGRHWNVADSSFLDVVTALGQKPSLKVAQSRTRAQTGDVVKFTALAPAGYSFRWSSPYDLCFERGARTAVLEFRCPQSVSGSIPVTVVAAAPDGQTLRVTRRVAVSAAPAPTVSLAGPTEVQPGAQFTLRAHAVGKAPFSYRWYGSAACVLSDPTAADTAVTCEAGSGTTVLFQVDVTQADGQGGSSPRLPVTVTDSAPAEVTAPSGARFGVVARSVTNPATVEALTDIRGPLTWDVLDGVPCAVGDPGGRTAQVRCDRGWQGLAPVVVHGVTAAGRSMAAVANIKVTNQKPAAAWRVRVLRRGNPVRVTGWLRDTATGAPLAGRPVAVQVRWAGSARWVTAKTLKTGATGQVTFRHPTPRPGVFRFRFPGSATHAVAVSTTAQAKGATRTRAALRAGRPSVVTGRLVFADGSAVRNVRVALQRRPPGAERWTGTVTVRSDARGQLRTAVTPGRRMFYRWSHAGTGTTTASRSRAVAVVR